MENFILGVSIPLYKDNQCNHQLPFGIWDVFPKADAMADPWAFFFQSSGDHLDFEPGKITVSLINGLPPWHDKDVCNLQNVWKFVLSLGLSFLKSVCLS